MKFFECPYLGVCSNVSDNCTQSCIRYKEMRCLLECSNIPESKWTPIKLSAPQCDRDAYIRLAEIKDNIIDYVGIGYHLYIASSTTGNGKTSWAIKILLKYFDSVWAGNGFKPRALFIHVPTFLLKCKDFSSRDLKFDELKSTIIDVDIVVWDDIASTSISSYDYSQLLMYLDARILNDKMNIYTGNIVDRQLLSKSLGDKLASRILTEGTEVIEFKGGDRR